MAKSGTEEKSPLLFVVDSNDDILKAKQKMYFETGRLHNITNGATTVFTNLPDFVGSCWITTAVCGLLFFMMLIMIMSSVVTNNIRVTRCISTDEVSNKTIHLVHAHSTSLWQPSEIEVIDKIITNYPDYKIHLILVQRESSWADLARSQTGTHGKGTSTSESIESSQPSKSTDVTTPLVTRRKKRKIDEMHFGINVEARRLLDMLLHEKLPGSSRTRIFRAETSTVKQITTVKDLLKVYPRIMVEDTSYNQLFFQSPLYAYWDYLNDGLKVFAARVLQLWQYGGVSFDLNRTIDRADMMNVTDGNDKASAIFNKKLTKFTITEKTKGSLVGVVTVDDEGLYMESKVPCHAFFEYILANLRRAHRHDSVKDVLRATVKTFCRHFPVNRDFCNMIMKTQ